MARAVLRERGAPLQRISAHLGDLVGSPGGGSRVVQQREKRDRGCDLAHDGLRSKEGSEGSGGGEGALAWRMTAWISPMTSFSLLFAPPSAPAPASVCTSNTHRSSVSPTSRYAYLSRDSPPPPRLLRLSPSPPAPAPPLAPFPPGKGARARSAEPGCEGPAPLSASPSPSPSPSSPLSSPPAPVAIALTTTTSFCTVPSLSHEDSCVSTLSRYLPAAMPRPRSGGRLAAEGRRWEGGRAAGGGRRRA